MADVKCLSIDVNRVGSRLDGEETLYVGGVDKASQHHPPFVFGLAESSKEGCACSLLHDDADWNAEHWLLKPAGLPRLEETIVRFNGLAKDGFTFQALWMGEKPETTVDVTVDEMRALVRQNGIGTKVRYHIRPDACSTS
jgi:hypothetical protein